MKKNCYFLIFILSIIGFSCNGDDVDETVAYKIVNINMTDLGKISTEFSFDINQKYTSDTLSCTLRTRVIKSGDVVDNIMVSSTGGELKISIITSPNDFSCNEVSCFSVHELNFDMIGLKKGKYNVVLGINNGYGKPFDYTIN